MLKVKTACLLGMVLSTGLVTLAQDKSKVVLQRPVVTPVLAGGEMFRAYCASCHGVDAKGNGPAASALKSLPTDLTQLSKRNAGKFPIGEVEDAIRGNTIIPAHGSREMPVWGQAFRSVNPDEAMIRIKVHNLALYIESLQAK